jgi:murein DD-endopeptidase MepM/ murein hydrolase activator NlpD
MLAVAFTYGSVTRGGHAPRAIAASAIPRLDGADRIDLIAERASRARDVARARFVRPASGPATGWWGERRRGHVHTGIDINGETGDRVVAAAFGTVSHAGPAPKGYSGYGNLVIVDHAGYQTAYAHLSRIDVAVGQIVDPGTLVGAIGTSGSVTGSHLHFEVRINGKPVDPKTVIPVL